MPIYILRLRDGNCVVASALNEGHARKNVEPLAVSEVVTVRELDAFVAQFVLNNDGQLTATLLDKETIADLHHHEYPMLGTANAQSYADFGVSEKDSKTEAVHFSSIARRHAQEWDERDKQIVRYAVEQERSRFAH
ncbi:MAG TPA: hypothetical protein VHA33_23440 [Candidatus Angelobacter sp.]|jgi:hypothetical protein|nr:hypothetical protein [Candidatus Angelobacter sp.]